jgi:toluene monooxygenase system protein D
MERVGPVLEASELGRAVVAAIRQQNAEVEVQDRGSYLRVLATGRCAITRQAVERILGQPFRLPSDLEIIMPSFQGSFSVTEDEAAWTFEERHE